MADDADVPDGPEGAEDTAAVAEPDVEAVKETADAAEDETPKSESKPPW